MRQRRDATMTSINIDSTLYIDFKRKAIEDKISLTLLVEKAIRTYLSQSYDNNNGSADLQKVIKNL